MIEHKPVLLLDVDGVINVLHSGVAGILDRGLVPHDALGADGLSYRLHIDPRVPTWLELLGAVCEIVWCTTWSNANDVISPLVGLPGDLRQVPLPASWVGEHIPLRYSAKSPYVRRWAAQNGVEALAWIDDDITAADSDLLTAADPDAEWLAGIEPLKSVRLFCVSPGVGMTVEHVEEVLKWVEVDD